MNEESLIGAYNPPSKAKDLGVRRFYLGTVEFRPCACGTWIGMADEDSPERAMRRHQETRQHRSWRSRNRL